MTTREQIREGFRFALDLLVLGASALAAVLGLYLLIERARGR
jgi:hypothetical protein